MTSLDTIMRLALNGFHGDALRELETLMKDPATPLSLVWALRPMQRELQVYAACDKGWLATQWLRMLERLKPRPQETR